MLFALASTVVCGVVSAVGKVSLCVSFWCLIGLKKS